MSDEVTPPAIWDGDRRLTGTEDFHNDFDPTAAPYVQPDRPQYRENYHTQDDGRAFSSYAITLQPGQAYKLLGQDGTRLFFYINAGTTNAVIIGDQSAVAQGIGYIVSGAERLSATAEVWAAAIGAQPVTVSYWVERKA